MARLGDVCTIYTGTGFPVQYQGNSQGKFPFYKVGDIAKNVTAGKVYLELCDNYVEADVVKKIKGSILPARTVVFAKIGEAVKLNRRAITSCECLIDNNAMGIAPNEAVLALDYFYHYMCQLRLETLAEATTVPSVKKSIVENLDIPVPSIIEQQMILKNLNKVSELIGLRKEQLAKLDQLVKSRFIELFGDPLSNPKGWTADIIKGVCTKITDGEHGSVARVDSGNVFLNAKHIKKDGTIDWQTVTYTSDEVHNKIYARCNPEPGDILLTTTGTIGNVAIVPNVAPFSMDRGITLLKLNRDKVNNIFVSVLLGFEGVQEVMKANVHASAIGHLFLNKVMQIPVIVPPIEVQEEFATFVEQTDKSKLVIQQSLEKLETLKKALMQKHFG